MKRIYLLFACSIIFLTTLAQPYDLVLNTPESGVQLHQAINSITFAPNYSYTPAGGTMLAEIVSQLISGNITYSNPIDPGAYMINTGLAVGSTPGTLLASGSAGYQIPIDVPTGTNGLQPAITLSYISNFSDGLVGTGWSTGGLSAIARVNRTLYHDGISDPVRGTISDRYALDGNRMIVTGGTYGASGSEYRTEIETFSKIIAYGTTGTGPEWFQVYTKSGLILEFGNDEGSRIRNNEGSILSWRINKISDRYNNYIAFNYIVSDDERPIGSILYTGNSSASQAPFASIQFNYKFRSDVNSYYYGGKEFIRDILLDNIEVKYNGRSFKKYNLTYTLDSHSQLIKVTEYSSQDAALNPVVFTWSSQTNQFSETTHYANSDNERYYHGDFNGDGRVDFVTVPVKSSYTSNDKWKLYLANSSGNMVYATQGDLNTYFETFLTGDFNGDGLSDLMMQEKHPETLYPDKKFYYFYASSGSSFTRSTSYYICYNSSNLNIVDYNGDGKLEFFFHNENNNWYLYTYTGSSIYSASIPSFGKFYIEDTGMHNRILDFNGDGCSDLLVLSDNGYKVYEFKGTNQILIETFAGINIMNDDFLLFGDYNGDGNIDIIKKDSPSLPDWSMLHLTSEGFYEQELQCFDSFDINYQNNRIFARDMNADGRSDVIFIGKGQNTSNPNTRINVCLSDGSDFSIQEHISSVNFLTGYFSTYPQYITWEEYYGTVFFHFEDYKGDGRSQFFYKCVNTSKSFSFASGTPNHLVNNVIDGFGSKTSIQYLPMSDANVYTRGTGAVFPVSDFSSASQLVSQVISDNGIGSTNTTTYSYEGAKIHRMGKGFLGFAKTTITDNASGIITETQTGYNGTYFYPQVNTIIKKLSTGTVEQTSNTWTEKVLDITAKRIYPYTQSTTQSNSLTGHSITVTVSAVDDYGNTGQIVKDYGNGVTETTINNYSGWINTSDWLIGRIGSSTVTFAKSGESSVVKTVRYTYDANSLIKPGYVYYYEGSSLEYNDNYDYDGLGNVTDVYTTGASIGSSQAGYSYTPNGDKLLTKTDRLGHVYTYSYDNFGRPQSEVDYLNNTLSYQYDASDRISITTSSSGRQVTTNYYWDGNYKPSFAIYGISQTANDGSVSSVWYDKSGRPLRECKKGFNGTMILIDNEYNTKGELYRISDPYFAGGSPVWTETYAYDNYGRVNGITRNGGRNTVYSYSGATITETTAGKVYSKTYNPDGTMAAAEDDGGSLAYTYYPDGKVKNITAPGAIVTLMQYSDAARNQTQLTDPSAGTITYTYNARGQILTQTNARGQTTTFSYHNDGRLNTIISPEGTTTYSYNGNKQLTGISSPGSVVRSFTYDNYGRINTAAEIISGSNFSTTFTYDSYGRLNTRTHPSGIVETLNYNSNGYLASISAGGAVRYSISAMNARQQVTSSVYGSSLNATFGFDAYGFPNSSSAGQLKDYRYVFDQVTGTLTSRQNYRQSLTESFGYDDLYRLTTVTGPQSLSMTYSDNGNLITKSDIGTTEFDYGEGASPYALTGLLSSTGVIPPADQVPSYTSYEQISQITQGVYSASWLYNSDHQRAKMTVTQGGSTILTRWYAGSDYMKETAGGVTKEYTYLGGNAYSAPVVAVTQGGATSYFYLLRDHLGSVTHVVRSDNTLEVEYSYDAWGRRRSANDWSYTLDAMDKAVFDGRGFTGHEHLLWFDLINMNGRLYDPLIARFLSPDNFVQAPDLPQAFNRYSYCLNNPLLYTDPDGEFPWVIAALALFGSYLGGVGSNEGELNPLQWDWKAPETYLGIGFGGLFGAVGGYGLLNPGTINLALGIVTPVGGIYIVGNQSDWTFQWTTIAGGSGEIEMNSEKENLPIRMPDKPKWDGPYFQGTEEEAIEMLIFDSKYLGIETSMFNTTNGFYFEAWSGNSLVFDYDELSLYDKNGPIIYDYNRFNGYKSNSISRSWRYINIYNINGNTFIMPRLYDYSRVIWRGHTHPRNAEPGAGDLLVARLFGTPMFAFGWSGVIHKYGGYDYWH